jgi:hypothetical protein
MSMPFAGYEDFDACVRQNGDKSDPEAYCASIKRDVEGESALSDEERQHAGDDPCWEGYTQVGMKTDENGNPVPNCVPKQEAEAIDMGELQQGDCPEGHVDINGTCVKKESIEGVPPSALDMSEARVFRLQAIDTKPIERVEEDGQVRYKHLKLLSPGVWTDAGSRETIYYSPEGISNLEMREDNVVNVMHDVDNDVSSVGFVDPKSLETDDKGHLYGDVVLHMDNSASEFADENLQQTLKTEGTKGFGGPSVEIDAEGQEIEFNAEKGMHELKAGILSGVGFVSNPASKPVSFSRQAATREVALADGDNAKGIYLKDGGMSDRKLMNMTEEEAQDLADALGVSVDELMNAMQAVGGDEEGEAAEEGESEEEDEEEEMGDYEEDEEEEEDTEMQGDAMEVVQEQIDDIWGEIEELKEEMMSGEEMSEELEQTRDELADAETVSELQEANEELSKRLAELEDEPKTLSDKADNGEWWDADGMVDPSTNSLR